MNDGCIQEPHEMRGAFHLRVFAYIKIAAAFAVAICFTESEVREVRLDIRNDGERDKVFFIYDIKFLSSDK